MTDWRPRAAKKNRKLLKKMHLVRGDCVLSNSECSGPIELHHVLGGKYGREDHFGNLVRLCHEHHHRITNNMVETRADLGSYIMEQRPDVIAYVCERLGPVSGDDWLRRRLFIG